MTQAVILLAALALQSNPKELGDVRFTRDLNAALETSRASGKPVLILFDEVPGCATCVHYGEGVLKQPLIVEAAETLFVPVAIYNNKGGADAEALAYFREPSWNNPVVRIVDAGRKMLAPRVAGDYSAAGLAGAMITALEAAKRPVPDYLRLFALEAAAEARGSERAVLAMYCFWSGEACLGAIDGVIATRAGFLGGHEVVEVELDPRVLSYGALLENAKKRGCATRVFAKNAQQARIARAHFGDDVTLNDDLVRPSPKDDKYHLAATAWRAVTMTRTQATRANAAIAAGVDPAKVLSPRQLAQVSPSHR